MLLFPGSASGSPTGLNATGHGSGLLLLLTVESNWVKLGKRPSQPKLRVLDLTSVHTPSLHTHPPPILTSLVLAGRLFSAQDSSIEPV